MPHWQDAKKKDLQPHRIRYWLNVKADERKDERIADICAVYRDAPSNPEQRVLHGGRLSYSISKTGVAYTYTMDDPSQLQPIVTSPTAGAGSGVLTWNKTNWLMTAY